MARHLPASRDHIKLQRAENTWQKIELLSTSHVPSVKSVTTANAFPKGVLLANESSTSFVRNAASITSTKKLNNIKERPVAPIGRAADSKSACWGFESLLACQCVSGIYYKA